MNPRTRGFRTCRDMGIPLEGEGEGFKREGGGEAGVSGWRLAVGTMQGKEGWGDCEGWGWGRFVRVIIGDRGTCAGKVFPDDGEPMHSQENPKVVSYRDLSAWKAAKALAVEVYRAVNVAALRNDFALVDQLRRAAISVPSNIAEGAGRGDESGRLEIPLHRKGLAVRAAHPGGGVAGGRPAGCPYLRVASGAGRGGGPSPRRACSFSGLSTRGCRRARYGCRDFGSLFSTERPARQDISPRWGS